MNLIIYALLLFLAACSRDEIDAAMGNPKHTCEYKTEAIATVRNLSGRDLKIRFCSGEGDLRSVDQLVPADRGGHTYSIWTYTKTKSYNASAAETCSNHGYRDTYDIRSFALLSLNDLNDFKLCVNLKGSYGDGTSAYEERFVVLDKNQDCPSGFSPYEQSQYRCQQP